MITSCRIGNDSYKVTPNGAYYRSNSGEYVVGDVLRRRISSARANGEAVKVETGTVVYLGINIG